MNGQDFVVLFGINLYLCGMKRVLTVIIVVIGICASCTKPKCTPSTSCIVSEICDTIKGISVSCLHDNVLEFKPDSVRAGIIFYPGAFIDCWCYASLAASLAQKGILCILPKPLCNVALLNKNIAVKLKAEHPDITEWYMGGHSFGGSIAAMCLGSNLEEFQGLVMIASYALNDISASGKKVIIIYGTEDSILDRHKYNECLENLPPDYLEFIIEGGNHSYFGEYGDQDGDGRATITRAQQRDRAAEAIFNAISNQ